MRPALIEGIVEPALLVLLREREGYGYEFVGQLARRQLLPQAVPPARIYEALRRLERDGAVASDREASPTGPDRRRYTLTPAGRERVARWIAALRLTDRGLHQLLDAYERSEQEVRPMGCCCCRDDDQHDRQPAEPARDERESEDLATRVAQLEAELQALKRQA